VLCWHALRISAGTPSRLRLPRARYFVDDAGSAHGWWIQSDSFKVESDTKVLLRLYQPPTAHLFARDLGAGRPRVPTEVNLRLFRYGSDYEIGRGWPLRWRMEGDAIEVALENRNGTMPLSRGSASDVYWLTVNWEDGGQSSTDKVGRDDLEGNLDLAHLTLSRE
jgi:hypothetical protein